MADLKWTTVRLQNALLCLLEQYQDLDVAANSGIGIIGRRLNRSLPGTYTPLHGDQMVQVTNDNDARNVADRGGAVDREYFLIRILASAVAYPYGLLMQTHIGQEIQHLCHRHIQ